MKHGALNMNIMHRTGFDSIQFNLKGKNQLSTTIICMYIIFYSITCRFVCFIYIINNGYRICQTYISGSLLILQNLNEKNVFVYIFGSQRYFFLYRKISLI